MTSKVSAALVAAALAACTLAAAQTNVYRWVDKDGKVHFSDTPPPMDAKQASQKRMGGGGPDEGALPFATQQAMKRNPVTMFYSDDCGEPCTQGRELLSRRGIPFGERNAQTNPADTQALKELIGSLEVPLLLVGKQKVKGFGDELWHSALDAAGYPRTRLPSQPPTRPTPAPEAPAPAAPAAAPGEAAATGEPPKSP